MTKQIPGNYNKKGIWVYDDLLPSVPEKKRLTLNEGNTPVFHVNGIFFKCEYENPTGSVKDRGMVCQISSIFSQNIKQAVISSSGNAAISAASYCRLAGIKLTVFVSKQVNKMKHKRLKDMDVKIILSDTPLKDSVLFARLNHAYHLRQSIDDNSRVGYKTIAYEMSKDVKNIDAVFIPVSSGSTLVGISRGFDDLGMKVAMHAVQTTRVHPISEQFDNPCIKESTSLADAIVAKYTPRKDEVISIIKISRGWGWTLDDKAIIEAHKFLIEQKIYCSYEGALALAAVYKAKRNNRIYKNPVCLLTGKRY